MNNQSWLPWWRDQQESTKSTCSTALSQVNVKSGQNIVVSLTSRCNIVVFQVQRWNCDWQSLQSVRHTEHRTGGPNFQFKVKRSHLPSTTATVHNLIIILRWSPQSCWWLSQCQWKDPVMPTKLCSNSLLYNHKSPSLSWAETSLDIQTVRQGGSQLEKYLCHACYPGWQWRNRSRRNGGDLHVGLHISH